MMRLVDISEAKAALSDLIDAVQNGEDVVIQRDGQPVVQLVKALPLHERARSAAAAEAIRKIGDRLTLGPGVTIRDLIDDGRKY